MDYKVRQGGLMRCCLASLDEAMEQATPSQEGDIVKCKYCTSTMIFVDDAWQWNHPIMDDSATIQEQTLRDICDMDDSATSEEQALQNTPRWVRERLGLENVSTFDEAVQSHMWGTRGPDNKQPLRYIRLIDAETDHLENILATQFQIRQITKRVILRILRDRGRNAFETASTPTVN